MALGDQVGKQAVDEINEVTIPEAEKAMHELLEPFHVLAMTINAMLKGNKKLVITLEDK